MVKLHLIDKSNWKDGEWINEPDLVIWTDKETGYQCIILRCTKLGYLSGYVVMPIGSKITCNPYNLNLYIGVISLYEKKDFALYLNRERTQSLIVNKECEVVGFDCVNDGDLFGGEITGSDSFPRPNDFLEPRLICYWAKRATYRNINFVIKECESLAMQLKRGKQNAR